MNSNNLDIKLKARKLGIPETALARYFHKSYSWLLQNLRFELSPQAKQKYFKAIDVIRANMESRSNDSDSNQKEASSNE